MSKLSFFLCTLTLVVLVRNLPHVAQAGVPFQRLQNLLLGIGDQGLYNSSDKVVSLTNESFKPLVLWKKYAILLEFYNSYCGHCRRFAPDYKQLAANLWPWRDVIKIMAIDCAADENNGICRDYEVMVYPTMRYFHPNFEGDAKGTPIMTQDIEVLRNRLAEFAMKENATTLWPNFAPVAEKTLQEFVENLPKDVDLAVVVYDVENSTLPAEMILDFNRYESIEIRRIVDADVASLFKLDETHKIAAIDLNSNVEAIPTEQNDYKHSHEAIEKYLRSKNIHPKEDELIVQQPSTALQTRPSLNVTSKEVEETLRKVQSEPGTVYQADLEQSLRYTIYHEITKLSKIDGEKLLALQAYMSVLKKYSPLGANGRAFLDNLYQYVMSHTDAISGSEFETKARDLEKVHAPVFSSSRFVGCLPSRSGLRGFTCGLWQLFHFMTVQAAENEKSSDPLEVLHAMHGYVKFFFGCSDCSNHFQVMATQRKIWNTTSKDNAVLWLWGAHNEVNSRLAGDDTEDPQFPKIQFPNKDECKDCYKESKMADEIKWDKLEVLNFMKRIHSPENVSYYGVDDESILMPTLARLRQKRYIENIFSDMDMRMGILLYGFCIAMMVVAVKMFLHKGYRKKAYSHDFLGKV